MPMPLGELVFDMVGALGRFLGRIVVEFIFEMLIKGTGYFIAVRVLRLQKADPDSILAIVLGFAFWGVVGVAAYALVASVW